jgi:type I restriction enzyme S subunit
LEDLLSDIQAGKSLLGTEVNVPNGKNAVLKVSAVGREGFRPEESKVLVNQDDFLSQFSVRSGDLLITRANTPELVGMSCLVDRDYPNLMLSDKTLRLVPKVNAPKMLLLEALRTAKFRQQLQSAATGTGAAMKNISQAKLRELSVFWPIEIENSETFLGNIQQFRNSYAGIRQRLHDVEKRHHILTNSVLGEG